MKLSVYEQDDFDLNEYRFAEAESYETPPKETPDTDEEEVNIDIGTKLKEFIQARTPKAMFLKWLIIFLILTYIVWCSISGLTALISDLEPSMLPHKVIYNVLYGNFTLGMITAVFMAAISAIILWAADRKIENSSAFKVAKNETYGSANFATDESMRGAVVFHKLSNPAGFILGKKGNVIVSERTDAMNIITNDALEDIEKELAACVDKQYIQRNLNFCVFGPPGSGKSYSCVRPNVFARIANGESFIVTDPSGEIYRDTAGIAEKNGYNVKILNLSTPSASNGWNPFDVLKAADPMEVQILTATLVHTILSNTADDNAKGDIFFDQSEENLLKALILYVAISPHFEGEPHERHMGTVYDLLTKLAAQEGILEEFSKLPESDPAKAPWKMFQGAGRLKTNFITGLASRLEIFQVDIIKEMFSHSEINLSELGEEKSAYYIVSSVTSNKMRFLLSLFFSCAFEQLINDAVARGGSVKVPVYFILDEFKAIGRINGFADKITNVRKYGLSIAMIFQDLNQLMQAYPDDFNTLMSACDTWVTLGVNDVDTAQKLSERSGIATIETKSEQHSKLKRAPIAPVDPMLKITESEEERHLMNPDEIIRYFDDQGTNKRKVLVFARNKNPYKLESYGWPLHYLADEVKDNKREVSEYIPPWQKEEWTLNKKRTFLGTDTNSSDELYGGKAKERDEFKEKARKPKQTYQEQAAKKPGGIVFGADSKSTHLVELGLDLSGKKKI